MYQHSFKPDGPWQGQFQSPQGALDAGRGVYGAVNRVYVGKMEPAYFADMFIGGTTLLMYMQDIAEDHGDAFVAAFETLPAIAKSKLDAWIREAIGEWESDLPEDLRFEGQIVKQVKGYTESMMVRPKDFE